MELNDLPPGHLGAVVTYLEMTRPPLPRPLPPSPFRLQRWHPVDAAKYRLLFRRIGGRWLWYSRLAMTDEQIAGAVDELHVVVDRDGIEVGMIELDFRHEGDCLIRFLGFIPELAGKGHGKWLFAQTLALAWRKGVKRVRVNTCTLDHPAALRAYLKAGFTAYRRALESFPDPRLNGLLPRDVAPQIPLIAAGD